MERHLHEIVDVSRDTFDSWDVDTQRARVEERLAFDTYAPDTMSVTPADCNLYNPALDVYATTHDWTDEGWRPIDDTRPLRSVQAYIPTTEALELLTDRSPLVEVAAGNGYLSHVINRNGGRSVPTDRYPPEVDVDPPVTTRHVHVDDDGERHVHHESLWTDVCEHDHRCVQSHPGKDVLLCHPPGANDWVEELLDLLGDDQQLILIAEWYPGADGTPEFYRRLHDNWRLEETFPVFDWASMHARGYVFARN